MNAVLRSVIAVALAAPSVAFAQGVFRGPYLNNVTTDAVTLIWESPAATTGVVRYGVPGSLTQTASSMTPATHHEVRLSGLSAPGAEHAYELDVSGTTYAGTFKTAVQGAVPFSFIVYGDNRSSPQQHQVVVDALLLEMPSAHFAINTGDLVSNGESEADWDAFFPVADPFIRNIPLFVAIGNHEIDGSNWDVTQRLFQQPVDVLPASNSEGFYHVVYGNVELIFLNVEVDHLYTLPLLAGDQEDWLTTVLGQRPAGVDHRFIFLHQGPYSSKTGRNGNFWLRQWLDDFRTAGIDVIFSGHDHYAERGFAKNGIYYVIHGGGGAPLYNTQGVRVTNDHTIVHSESRLGYLRVDIDGPKAHVMTKGIGGEIVDEFTYGDAALPACVQASDCGAAPATGCPGGAWECEKSACRFACPSGSGGLVMCLRDNDCDASIGATCMANGGTVSCEHPSLSPTSWYCTCVLPPDCMVDADCANRPSPIPGCTGTWACVDTQCEFTTVMCMPVPDAGVPDDAGTAAPDAGAAADAAGGAPDATAADEDAGGGAPLPADAGAPGDAGVPADASAAGSSDASALAGAPAEGCACSAALDAGAERGAHRGSTSALFAAIFFAFAFVRRSFGAGRAGR